MGPIGTNGTTPPPPPDDYEAGGLGTDGKSQWPKITPAQLAQKPIDRLVPNSKLHGMVLDYLIARIQKSERAMSAFYPRWQVLEHQMQAYINLPDWEKELQSITNTGAPPKVVSIVVPYTFSTISTIVTFLLHVFTSRRPMWPVESYKAETIANAANMETVLQFQSDMSRMVRHLHLFLQHTQVYGFGAIRTHWESIIAMRTSRKAQQVMGADGQVKTEFIPERSPQLTYEGNICEVQDPYYFFPDPRVPMVDCPKKGEFAFWRLFEGRHAVKKAEAAGMLKWVDYAGDSLPRNEYWLVNRINVAGGEFEPASERGRGGSTQQVRSFIQIDQGTCEIIPAELGLGDSTRPEKWLFTILNKKQIVQAVAFDADHDMHPVSVSEPYCLSLGFGNLGMADYAKPFQDTMGWLVNSRMDNVRRTHNDMFLVDPTSIEMQDFKKPGPGRIIRLKQSAVGRDVRTILQQIPISDVTSSHLTDLGSFFSMGERVTAASDNLQGIQDSGGRKTATEVRTAGEFATSRLGSIARLISAQGLTNMTEMMCLNTQQYQSMDFFLRLTGIEGARDPIFISPDMLVGNFHFPVLDGSIPIDKVAMSDVWKEIMVAVIQDPDLRMQYDMGKIFEYTAELAGARNLSGFRIQPGSPEAIQKQVQAGNLVPANQAPNLGSQTRGVVSQPGRRMLGVANG